DPLLVFLLGISSQVQDEEPIGDRHLVRGQADAPRSVHQLEHRTDLGAKIVIDLGDSPRLVTQRRVWVTHDLHAGLRNVGHGRDRQNHNFSYYGRAALPASPAGFGASGAKTSSGSAAPPGT